MSRSPTTAASPRRATSRPRARIASEFVAVGPSAAPFLDWWCEREERAALEPGGAEPWGPWTELVPALFPFHPLRDPGCGASIWNLHTRDVRATNDGYDVSGSPLRWFHFDGYSPDAPHLLSATLERPRILLAERPAPGAALRRARRPPPRRGIRRRRARVRIRGTARRQGDRRPHAQDVRRRAAGREPGRRSGTAVAVRRRRPRRLRGLGRRADRTADRPAGLALPRAGVARGRNDPATVPVAGRGGRRGIPRLDPHRGSPRPRHPRRGSSRPRTTCAGS